MDDDRRRSYRRAEDAENALLREHVRALLKEDGYLTEMAADDRYLQLEELRDRTIDRRARVLMWVAIVSVLSSPFLTSAVNHLWK